MLEHHADVFAHFINIYLFICDPLSVNDDFATVGFLQFVEAAQKGTLAGTRRSYQADHFSLFYFYIHAL